MRAHFIRPVTDPDGAILPNVQVNVFNPATTTPISQTLYSSDTENSVLSNPYVSSTGIIDLYLDTPTRVRIGIVQGGLPMQFYEDVDVLAAGSDSQHSGSGPESLVIGSAASADGDSSVALGASASSGGLSAVALGSSTNAVADCATALGVGSAVSGVGGVAAGRNATSAGLSATALGDGAQTNADNATAVGTGAVAGFASSTAVGVGAQSTQEHQIMLGTPQDVTEIPQGSALVLSDANGIRWRITVNTDGSLETDPA